MRCPKTSTVHNLLKHPCYQALSPGRKRRKQLIVVNFTPQMDISFLPLLQSVRLPTIIADFRCHYDISTIITCHRSYENDILFDLAKFLDQMVDNLLSPLRFRSTLCGSHLQVLTATFVHATSVAPQHSCTCQCHPSMIKSIRMSPTIQISFAWVKMSHRGNTR